MKEKKKLRRGMRVKLKTGQEVTILDDPPATIGNKNTKMPHGPIVLDGYVYVVSSNYPNKVLMEKIDDIDY
jgi:hypothetical protein